MTVSPQGFTPPNRSNTAQSELATVLLARYRRGGWGGAAPPPFAPRPPEPCCQSTLSQNVGHACVRYGVRFGGAGGPPLLRLAKRSNTAPSELATVLLARYRGGVWGGRSPPRLHQDRVNPVVKALFAECRARPRALWGRFGGGGGGGVRERGSAEVCTNYTPDMPTQYHQQTPLRAECRGSRFTPQTARPLRNQRPPTYNSQRVKTFSFFYKASHSSHTLLGTSTRAWTAWVGSEQRGQGHGKGAGCVDQAQIFCSSFDQVKAEGSFWAIALPNTRRQLGRAVPLPHIGRLEWCLRGLGASAPRRPRLITCQR